MSSKAYEANVALLGKIRVELRTPGCREDFGHVIEEIERNRDLICDKYLSMGFEKEKHGSMHSSLLRMAQGKAVQNENDTRSARGHTTGSILLGHHH